MRGEPQRSPRRDEGSSRPQVTCPHCGEDRLVERDERVPQCCYCLVCSAIWRTTDGADER